jgi:hypothetical protein
MKDKWGMDPESDEEGIKKKPKRNKKGRDDDSDEEK